MLLSEYLFVFLSTYSSHNSHLHNPGGEGASELVDVEAHEAGRGCQAPLRPVCYPTPAAVVILKKGKVCTISFHYL